MIHSVILILWQSYYNLPTYTYLYPPALPSARTDSVLQKQEAIDFSGLEFIWDGQKHSGDQCFGQTIQSFTVKNSYHWTLHVKDKIKDNPE